MPEFTIDTTSYPKAARYTQRHGYQLRGASPTSIIIHSTSNSRPGTSFEGEATYLLESADVSAHFLISKDGRIIRFLEPRAYQAWHAGMCLEQWSNAKSIGIELHTSVGETPTAVQREACAWLCRELMREFQIGVALVDTHRAVARPIGRKSDPAGWSDADFYAWREQLSAPKVRQFRFRGWPIFQQQRLAGTLAGYLQSNEAFSIDRTYSNGSAHLSDGRGFIDLDLNALEEIQG